MRERSSANAALDMSGESGWFEIWIPCSLDAMLLMKKLNSQGERIEPCRTPDRIGIRKSAVIPPQRAMCLESMV